MRAPVEQGNSCFLLQLSLGAGLGNCLPRGGRNQAGKMREELGLSERG